MNFAVLIFLAISAASALPRLHKSVPERIVGGVEAYKGEFPYIVQIKRSNSHYCAGIIVNENWVLTAAHCAIATAGGYTLVAGEHDLDIDEDSEQSSFVSEVIWHPYYNPYTMANDLAVMRLGNPFRPDYYVQTVTLPNATFTPADELTVAGWGTLSSGGSLSTTLMKVTVPLVSQDNCRNAYGSELLPGMLCAGTAGKDSCQGDSGGPLMSNFTLAGIVSWGYGCADDGFPGIYTDVTYFLAWIKEYTNTPDRILK